MADLNSWSITGRLTKDAEFKILASGKSLLICNVAVNTGYGDYKKTTFVRVQMWGERGKNIQQYLVKSSLIACAGELTTNEWTGNKDGQLHTDLQLDTYNIQILASKSNKNDNEKSLDNAQDDIAF